MESFIHQEISPGVTMFRGLIADGRLTFNAYLIRGSESALLHTGPMQSWQALRQALMDVAPLNALRYVIVPHFESDECGALSTLLAEARPQVVASVVGARQIEGFGLASQVRTVRDGEVLALGPGYTLEFIAVPSEMHLWDGIMVYHRESGILFSNDFMAQMGSEPGMLDEEVAWKAMAAMQAGNIPCLKPFQATATRLGALPVTWIAPGHGSVIQRDAHEAIRRYFTTRL